MLTPERRAELRGLAESARPVIRYGGTDPAAVYVPAAELAALLDAADERDRLADWRDQWQEMRHDAVGEASRRWPEGTIRASRWDGIMIDGERSLLVQRKAFIAGAEWVALHEAPQLRSAVERVRALADNWERLDRAFLAAGTAGMSMPAVDAVRQLRELLSALDGADDE